MICYDFRCLKCGQDWEAIFPSAAQATQTLPCNCGGEAQHIWKSFGGKGRIGGEKGRYPRYEIQAGRTFHSAKEENAYLKSKGLEKMGPDEYRRSVSYSEPEPDYSGIKDCMKEAWAEAEAGIVHQHKVVDKEFRWIESTKESTNG